MVHFEWDERKNRSNLDKHGIDFETAQWIFEDPLCVTFVERTEDVRSDATGSALSKV